MVALSLLSLLYIGLNIHCCSYSQLAVFQIYYKNSKIYLINHLLKKKIKYQSQMKYVDME